ncbi:hypothetical protein EB001_07840 [bacterium]|jgi:hypothetical protein|nr:hypothetical protein [bacterium]
MQPQNIQEWVLYITQIPEDELINQARWAGSMKFIDMLKEEGYSMTEITQIHTAFALRFKKTGRRIPLELDDCAVNYFDLANPLF